MYHVKPLGSYRLASELRSHGYKVLVIDFFGQWLDHTKNFYELLKMVISEETVFVGYSGTFFSDSNTISSNPKSWNEYDNNSFSLWPTEQKKIAIINHLIKKINPSVKIFYGGSKASQIDTNFKHSGVDYLVQGLADGIIVDLVQRLKKKLPLRFNLLNGIKNIDYDITGAALDFARSQTIYEASDVVDYDHVLPLETSRGCLFKCSFCAYPLLGRKKGDPEYHRHGDMIRDELLRNFELHGIRKYMIVDDTFNETTAKLESLNEILSKNNLSIEFSCYLRSDLLERFPEQIQLLKDMGLRSAFLGIESLNPATYRAIGKKSEAESIKNTLTLARATWNKDVAIFASFIAGLPYDDEDTINDWMQWVYDQDFLFDNFNLRALSIANTLYFNSDIQRRPDHYGYEIVDPLHQTWVNNLGLSLARAREISTAWMERSYRNSRLRVAGWEMLGMQNLGFSYEELQTYTVNALPYDEMNRRNSEKFFKYQQRLYDVVR